MNFLDILNILKEKNPKLTNFFQPGLRREEIEQTSEHLGITFPDSLFDLYLTVNGTKWENVQLSKLWLFPGAMLLPLEKAKQLYVGRAGADKYWKEGMFPIFSSGGGEFFLIDLEPKSSSFSALFYYCPTEVDFDVIITYFDNLESCFQTIVSWYDKQAFNFEYSSDPFLKINRPLFKKIGMIHNTKSKYWTLY